MKASLILFFILLLLVSIISFKIFRHQGKIGAKRKTKASDFNHKNF